MPWAWVIGISLSFLIFGTLIPIWYKRLITRCPRKWRLRRVPAPQPRKVTTHELNRCESGLQVQPGDVLTQEDPTTPEEPTKFVRHGQGLVHHS
jgi:hypothetical protein